MGTPRPTKWAPPKYDDGKKSNWKKSAWKKTQKPKPTKSAWKKDSKPTWQKTQKYDHETVEKEAVSHIYNPYDIRQRGIVTAQLKERIESDMQELAALDALETEVSEEDLDGEGVIEMASSHGQTGNMCSSRWSCQSNCCERNRCVEKVRDWASIHYCPSECRGWAFAPTGTC